MWPDVPLGRTRNGWMWPGTALHLPSLAPRYAPRGLVSDANVRDSRPSEGYRIVSPIPSISPVEEAAALLAVLDVDQGANICRLLLAVDDDRTTP